MSRQQTYGVRLVDNDENFYRAGSDEYPDYYFDNEGRYLMPMVKVKGYATDGPWIIHRDPATGRKWNLTHLASGLAIVSNAPTLKSLRLLVALLKHALPAEEMLRYESAISLSTDPSQHGPLMALIEAWKTSSEEEIREMLQ